MVSVMKNVRFYRGENYEHFYLVSSVCSAFEMFLVKTFLGIFESITRTANNGYPVQ